MDDGFFYYRLHHANETADQEMTGTPVLFAVRGKCGEKAAHDGSMKKIFGAAFGERGSSASCGTRPGTLSLDPATFEKVDETFNLRSF